MSNILQMKYKHKELFNIEFNHLLSMTKIIGISGVTGAGKTTLARALAKELNATLISWDDFDDISTSPDDYVDWYYRGQNYKEWDYAALAMVLQSLKLNQPVLHPVSQRLLTSTQYIIFDAPLGRLHYQTGQYIDFCIHIEVPLDVSLCRRLLRDYKKNNRTKSEFLDEIEFYLKKTRPLFFDDKLKEKSDFVLDEKQKRGQVFI